MQIWTSSVALVVGALVGSGLGALAERLPRGLPLWRPERACPSCGAPRQIWVRVPLLRYGRASGRCQSCGHAPARREVWIEGATALLSTLVTYVGWGTPRLWPMLLVLWLGIAATAIDLEHRLIPNRLLLAAALLGLLALAPGGPAAYEQGFLGFAALFLVGLLLAVAGRGGLGFGDVKYLAVVGWLLGWVGGLLTLVAAVVLGGLYAAFLLLTRRAGRKDTIAFGPFIAAGSLVAALWVGTLHPPRL